MFVNFIFSLTNIILERILYYSLGGIYYIQAYQLHFSQYLVHCMRITIATMVYKNLLTLNHICNFIFC